MALSDACLLPSIVLATWAAGKGLWIPVAYCYLNIKKIKIKSSSDIEALILNFLSFYSALDAWALTRWNESCWKVNGISLLVIIVFLLWPWCEVLMLFNNNFAFKWRDLRSALTYSFETGAMLAYLYCYYRKFCQPFAKTNSFLSNIIKKKTQNNTFHAKSKWSTDLFT